MPATKKFIGTDPSDGEKQYATVTTTEEGHRILFESDDSDITLVLHVDGNWEVYSPERLDDREYRHSVTWNVLGSALAAAEATCR